MTLKVVPKAACDPEIVLKDDYDMYYTGRTKLKSEPKKFSRSCTFKGTVASDVFLIIRAYLVHKTRIFKLLVFGPMLVEIGKLFGLFIAVKRILHIRRVHFLS